jgi:sugar O-acyltransferase (sialic acid O-acetyltransferase NeuD family)
MAIPIVGFGAGGHARVVIEILRYDSQYEIIGLFDPREELIGQDISGVPVLGNDGKLPEIIATGVKHFFIGVGGVSDLSPRRRLYEYAISQGMIPVTVIHPKAVISSTAILGEGVTLMAGVLINSGARLGDNVVINTGAIVEHDCVVGNHVHIATGAILCGGANIGSETHIGAGATILQYRKIGSSTVVGAGAVVVKDVLDKHVMIGNPAKPMEKHKHASS